VISVEPGVAGGRHVISLEWGWGCVAGLEWGRGHVIGLERG
jgi:hypothetical protein